MAQQVINIGTTANDGTGESLRSAFDKANDNFGELYSSVGTLEVLEAIAGGAGFVNASAAVSLDLSLGRSFHSTMVGNITSLAFTNVPTDTAYSASWSWVLRINGTGGYTLAGTPAVTFVDGSSWSDLDLTANAENILTFWRVGAITYGAIVTTGELALDPYKVCFLENATILLMTEAESIDVASDTQNGDGTITFEKNGVSITTRTTFAVGDRLGIICTGSTGTTTVRVPRYAL